MCIYICTYSLLFIFILSNYYHYNNDIFCIATFTSLPSPNSFTAKTQSPCPANSSPMAPTLEETPSMDGPWDIDPQT